MAEPSNPDEATNTESVPQPARPAGSRPDSDWTAVSGTGDAEYGEPAAERGTADRGFATSADSPLESDVNQRIPAPDPATAERAARSAAGDDPMGNTELPAEEFGVPGADPSDDLSEGPPDGR